VSESQAPRPALALFDFDGTLTMTESFASFLRMVAPRARLCWGGVLVLPLVLAYRLKFLPGVLVRAAILFVAARGLDAAAVAAAGERHARERVPATLRPDMLARLRWHRERGDVVVVVTGTFDVCVRAWCDTEGVALLASSLEQHDGRLTGAYAGAQCVGLEKVRRVRETFELAAFSRIFAYGDSVEDFPMLALADEAVYRGRPWPGRA
jgi:HAD superfamily hydrolase (TIGR01490 family)